MGTLCRGRVALVALVLVGAAFAGDAGAAQKGKKGKATKEPPAPSQAGRTASLDLQAASLADALEQLKARFDIRYVASEDAVEGAKPVTLKGEFTLGNALAGISRQAGIALKLGRDGVVAAFPSPPAMTYFVSPSGNDGNPGSLEKPWKTISRAAAALEPGDTVRIRTGTYAEQVVPQRSGTEGAPIVYEAFPGEKPVIEGQGVRLSAWRGLFWISGKRHITVVGLTVQNAGPSESNAGIRVSDGSESITLRGNRTYDTASSGIGVWNSRNVLVEENEIELACNDGTQECLTIAGTEDFEVRNNHVHHSGPGTNGGEGINVKDGCRRGKVHHNHVHHIQRLGIYVDSWKKSESDIEVFENRVHDSERDGLAVAAEAGGLLERVRIYRNIVYQNKHNGLTFADWGEPGASRPMKDIRVEENIFWGNGVAGWGGGILLDNPQAAGLVVRHNLVSSNRSFQIAVKKMPVSASIEGNLIDGFRGSHGETWGESPVKGSPGFQDPENGNFGVRPGSPASEMLGGDSRPAP